MLNNNLTTKSTIADQIKTAHFRKNRKTGSIDFALTQLYAIVIC